MTYNFCIVDSVVYPRSMRKAIAAIDLQQKILIWKQQFKIKKCRVVLHRIQKQSITSKGRQSDEANLSCSIESTNKSDKSEEKHYSKKSTITETSNEEMQTNRTIQTSEIESARNHVKWLPRSAGIKIPPLIGY